MHPSSLANPQTSTRFLHDRPENDLFDSLPTASKTRSPKSIPNNAFASTNVRPISLRSRRTPTDGWGDDTNHAFFSFTYRVYFFSRSADLEITFDTKQLAKLCNSSKEMRAGLGKRNADKLKQRLNELAAAETLEDMRHLPGPRCHELTGKLKGKLAVDLVHPYRLVFSPDHDPVPTRTDGGLNWAEVTGIRIDAIVDYH